MPEGGQMEMDEDSAVFRAKCGDCSWKIAYGEAHNEQAIILVSI